MVLFVDTPLRAGQSNRILVSPLAAAEYLGVSEKTIRRYVSQGSLAGYRIGRQLIRVDLDEVEKLIKLIKPTGPAGDPA